MAHERGKADSGQSSGSHKQLSDMGDGRNQQTQTRYLQNGAYMRLKNLRIFASAENVWTITSLPQGYDPETAYSAYTGNNSGKTYPLGTTVSLGLNITF